MHNALIVFNHFFFFRDFFLQLQNDEIEFCSKDDFLTKGKAFGAKIDDELYLQIAEEWYSTAQKKVDLHGMAAYYINRHKVMTAEDF